MEDFNDKGSVFIFLLETYNPIPQLAEQFTLHVAQHIARNSGTGKFHLQS